MVGKICGVPTSCTKKRSRKRAVNAEIQSNKLGEVFKGVLDNEVPRVENPSPGPATTQLLKLRSPLLWVRQKFYKLDNLEKRKSSLSTLRI